MLILSCCTITSVSTSFWCTFLPVGRSEGIRSRCFNLSCGASVYLMNFEHKCLAERIHIKMAAVQFVPEQLCTRSSVNYPGLENWMFIDESNYALSHHPTWCTRYTVDREKVGQLISLLFYQTLVFMHYFYRLLYVCFVSNSSCKKISIAELGPLSSVSTYWPLSEWNVAMLVTGLA